MKLSIALTLSALAASQMAHADDWTGAYAGLQLGNSDITTSGAADLTGDGNSVGLFAGYNMQNGSTVFGGEIDFDDTDYLVAGSVPVEDTMRLKARVGTEVAGGLLYGSLGVVMASSSGLGGDDNGTFLGLGYDMPIGQGVFAGAEFLSHNFNDFNDTGIDIRVNTLKARVGFKF